MLTSIGLLIIGTIFLYYGAEWIIKGGVHIANQFHISPLIIGLTIIAFGTSLPELVVSLKAALSNSSTIAIGNVVGSNVANVGLVLGLSTLIFPVTMSFKAIRRDLFIYIVVCIVFILVIIDGLVSRVEGAILFAGIIIYTWHCIKRPTDKVEKTESTIKSNTYAVFILAAGTGVLYFGADFFVKGAVDLARTLGISEIVIGMSVVAFGTSLPELATSVVAAFRKESAISIGNIVGSNLFNILSVIGLVSLIKPLNSPKEIVFLEVPFMIAFGLVLIPIGLARQPISRMIAVILLIAYVVFIILLFAR